MSDDPSEEISYSLAWLTLRQPLDHEARSSALVERLRGALSSARGPTVRGEGEPLRLVDLACGHGSNLRYLCTRLPGPQAWTAIDHNPQLLAFLDAEALPAGVTVETRQLDLQPGVDDVPWEADAVVTSALLDLVSEAWLASLARRCARDRTPVLAALTVDGRVAFSPHDPDDSDVMRWFRQHQTTDRGFGPSPGPQAASCFAALLEAEGMDVWTAHADWEIDAGQQELLDAMVRGIARASAECSPRPTAVAAWLERRLVTVQRGELSMMVGHTDLLGLPVAD